MYDWSQTNTYSMVLKRAFLQRISLFWVICSWTRTASQRFRDGVLFTELTNIIVLHDIPACQKRVYILRIKKTVIYLIFWQKCQQELQKYENLIVKLFPQFDKLWRNPRYFLHIIKIKYNCYLRTTLTVHGGFQRYFGIKVCRRSTFINALFYLWHIISLDCCINVCCTI